VGTATPGDVIGMYETLAGAKLDAAVTAHGEAHLLRLDRAALFELLADHTDLLQGVFSILLRAAVRREQDLKNGLHTGAAADGNGAAVTLDDRLHDRQPQT
jgi:CRP-like cAMP-binding protein